MQEILEEVLLLQPDWSASNTLKMERRGVLVRQEAADWLRERLPELSAAMPAVVDDLRVEGRDGTGLKTEIPWVRVHSLSRSPSATEGWYIVYLFSAEGDRVYLSLNQGTTRWENGEFRARPASELEARVIWARARLAEQVAARPDLVEAISLDSRRTTLGTGYELGNVFAVEYTVDDIPSPTVLEADLEFMAAALGKLYATIERAVAIPGELAPEVSDVITAAERAAGKRSRGQGIRLTAAERTAIERRAVAVASAHLKSLNFTVKDVGASKSYDLDAKRDSEHLFVEVKGTTSVGEEVILTRAEVELHQAEHPKTVLMVVSGIDLDRSVSPPVASGGSLAVVHPWMIEAEALTVIAYRYRVPAAASALAAQPGVGGPEN